MLRQKSKKFYCNNCSKKFPSAQSIYQQKQSKIHLKSQFDQEIIYKVGDNTIQRQEFSNLLSEKEWISDSVSYISL